MVELNVMTGNNQSAEGSSLRDLTDEELARDARSGSNGCFDELVVRYGTRLYQFLRKRLPTDQDAEDLAQETFIKAYRNIDRYDHTWNFSTWLYTIASRLAVSHYRTKRWKLTNMTQSDLPTDLSTSATPDDFLARSENSRNLWNVARTLKPEFYEALWLRYVEEMSMKEIAAVMNKPQISVRVLLHRARLKLTRRFDHPALLGNAGKEGAAAAVTEPKLSVL
ncbi:MAG: sigma-70 family RNA polymerase sigma factor [bacterium]|nr:sigma-70 family RNA polymerase sigma factor [bacterium]